MRKTIFDNGEITVVRADDEYITIVGDTVNYWLRDRQEEYMKEYLRGVGVELN